MKDNIGTDFKRMMLFLTLVILVLGYLFVHQANKGGSVENLENEKTISYQHLFVGRYVMGLNRIYVKKGMTGKDAAGIMKKLDEQLMQSANNTMERISIVPLLGEMSDVEKALDWSREIRSRNDLTEKELYELNLMEDLVQNSAKDLSGPEKRMLVERYGWFAEVGLTMKLPDDDPEKRKVLKPALQTARIMISGFSLFMILMIGGVIMLILAVLKFQQGKLTSGFLKIIERYPLRRNIWLETMVLFLAVMLGAPLLIRKIAPEMVWLSYLLIPAVLLWPKFRDVSWAESTAVYGWIRGQGVAREIGSGFLGYLAGIPLIACGFFLSVLLMKTTGVSQPMHPIVSEFRNAGVLKILGLFSLAVLYAPVLEETVFRGVFYYHVRGKRGVVFSGILTSFVFAVIHPQGLIAVPVIGAIGMVLAMLREWRGSLLASMTAHALNNLIVTLIIVLLFR